MRGAEEGTERPGGGAGEGLGDDDAASVTSATSATGVAGASTGALLDGDGSWSLGEGGSEGRDEGA